MIGKLIEKAQRYLQIKLDVLKLSLIERVAIIMGFCMFMMLGMMFALAIIILAGIGLSEYFAEVTGSVPGGYFIVTGIYATLLLILFLLKRNMLKWFAGLFVNLLTNDAAAGEDTTTVNNNQVNNNQQT